MALKEKASSLNNNVGPFHYAPGLRSLCHACALASARLIAFRSLRAFGTIALHQLAAAALSIRRAREGDPSTVAL